MVRALSSLAGAQGSLAQRLPRSVAGPMSSLKDAGGPGTPAIGQAEFTTPGTYAWTVPDNVFFVSAVTIGGGAAGSPGTSPDGGAGGGLSYVNAIPVTPGEELTVIVGSGGDATGVRSGGTSSVQRSGVDLVAASGASSSRNGNGTPVVGTGGSGGNGGADRAVSSSKGWGTMRAGGGGGGAGGYTGNGGQGAHANSRDGGWSAGGDGAGGAGAGGGAGDCHESTSVHSGDAGKAGGGVGIYGEGPSGVGSTNNGSGGSGGTGGVTDGIQAHGGVFGGGGGGGRRYVYVDRSYTNEGGNGGSGAVRMIWPGTERLFPATRTADETQE